MNESFDRLVWPDEPTIEKLAAAVGDAVGLKVQMHTIPPEHQHSQVSGLTYAVNRTAHVFYDDQLSPLLREQTILHEFAHLLHGDVIPDADPIHYRSMFNDPREHRAELTATRLWQALQDRRRHGTAVLDFITGRQDRA